MSIYAATFQLGQIAKAIGRKPGTLKTWLHQGVVIGHGDVSGGGGPGQRREFSWHNCMEFAVASELLKVTGLSVVEAFQFAGEFSHVDSVSLSGKPARRQAGFPFETSPRTLMAISPGTQCQIYSWSPRDDLFSLIRNDLCRPVGFSILDLTEVFDRTCAGLGLHREAVLAEAYSVETE